MLQNLVRCVLLTAAVKQGIIAFDQNVETEYSCSLPQNKTKSTEIVAICVPRHDHMMVTIVSPLISVEIVHSVRFIIFRWKPVETTNWLASDDVTLVLEPRCKGPDKGVILLEVHLRN